MNMDERKQLSRRRFLLATATLAVGLAVGGKRSWDHRVGVRLGQILGEREAARAIGRAWLATNPQEGKRRRLIRDLLADLGFRARFAGLDDLRQLVADRVRFDYAAGRIAQVEGWVLSRTEVRPWEPRTNRSASAARSRSTDTGVPRRLVWVIGGGFARPALV